jgi:hypothetical protein
MNDEVDIVLIEEWLEIPAQSRDIVMEPATRIDIVMEVNDDPFDVGIGGRSG